MSEHMNGLYFGLPEEDYHAVPALSFSGIKKLLRSPMDFWADSWLNPDYADRKTPAMTLGKAWHKYVLEGADAFRAEYCAMPEAGDYHNVLHTAEDMKDWLRQRKLPVTGRKSDLVSRILDADPSAMIWDRIVENAVDGRVVLSKEDVERIEFSAGVLRGMPTIADAFRNGYPEVSYFWTDEETGVPMKCRIDYLKPSITNDLKTFSNKLGKPVDVAVNHEIANNRYLVQGVTYTDAIEHAKAMGRSGKLKVHGDVDPAFIKELVGNDRHRFFFIFQQSDIPVVEVRELSRWETYGGNGGSVNAYWLSGQMGMRKGIALFQEYSKRFEPGVPWITAAQVRQLVDSDLPIYALEA